jgi:lipopolysaccharide/colanic/teichoic acid biosynthesis glycosyltransferase
MIDLIALPGVPQATHSRTRYARWSATTAQSDGTPASLGHDVRLLVGSGWAEEIVVRADERREALHAAVEAGRLAGRRVRIISPASMSELPEALPLERWVRDQDAWVLVPPRRSRMQLAVKRLIDIGGAAVLLALLSPVLLVIAIMVKLTSDGPVLYPWRVLGENGRPFIGYKFRTMVREADALKAQLQHLNERSGPVFKMAKDPRVTPLGRWLRKHSLDELPQLWSVLVGDMTLVGPRPPGPDEYRNFELWQMRKLSVKPGMTCLWQVEGRSTVTDFADWARLDLRYIDTWSLRSDFQILLRTAAVVVKGTGT